MRRGPPNITFTTRKKPGSPRALLILISTWLPTESEAPSINPKYALFSFVFPRTELRVFPGSSLFLAILTSVLATGDWRFAFPGDSRVLAIPIPPGDSPHVLAGHGLVVLQHNTLSKVRSWLLFWCPAPSSFSQMCGALALLVRIVQKP